jgi:hypothetical protein
LTVTFREIDPMLAPFVIDLLIVCSFLLLAGMASSACRPSPAWRTLHGYFAMLMIVA